VNPTIVRLKNLYAKPSPHRAAREATLAPILAEAADLHARHSQVITQHALVAREAASITMPSVSRYATQEAARLIGRLVDAAQVILHAGATFDVLATVQTAADQLDAPQDRAFEAAAQLAKRDLDRLRGTVGTLELNATILTDLLVTLSDMPLAADAVRVPPIERPMEAV
jgi:hypothetical protein